MIRKGGLPLLELKLLLRKLFQVNRYRPVVPRPDEVHGHGDKAHPRKDRGKEPTNERQERQDVDRERRLDILRRSVGRSNAAAHAWSQRQPSTFRHSP